MSLTKDDLQKVQNIFVSERKHTNESLDKQRDKIVNVIKSEVELINIRIDTLEINSNKKFEHVFDRLGSIEGKVERLIKTEDEDIQVAYKEIAILKKKVKRLELKLG